MSLNILREMFSNANGEVIEKVEVNLRNLIDKILARYSTEFTIYRELLQNSDDANATKVEIRFTTEKTDNDNDINMSDKCTRISFKNNGFPFRSEDWKRLKSIGEGNPDEGKIGAFGVGFYSLFSVCDDPIVSSGGQTMAFFWEENQLLIRRPNNDQHDDIWTTFLMNNLERENGVNL